MNITNLSKNFNGSDILKNFSVETAGSGVTCFFGPSGCGKTTLMNLIAGLLPVDSGSITGLPEKISVAFQDDRLLPWHNALLNVSCVSEGSDKRSADFLSALGLGFDDFAKLPAELSGGGRKRVNIARALNYDFGMLILDEPFKGMDSGLKKTAFSVIIEELRERPVCLITHDTDEALALSDEVIILKGPPIEIVSRFNISAEKGLRFINGEISPELIVKYGNKFLC